MIKSNSGDIFRLERLWRWGWRREWVTGGDLSRISVNYLQLDWGQERNTKTTFCSRTISNTTTLLILFRKHEPWNCPRVLKEELSGFCQKDLRVIVAIYISSEMIHCSCSSFCCQGDCSNVNWLALIEMTKSFQCSPIRTLHWLLLWESASSWTAVPVNFKCWQSSS